MSFEQVVRHNETKTRKPGSISTGGANDILRASVVIGKLNPSVVEKQKARPALKTQRND